MDSRKKQRLFSGANAIVIVFMSIALAIIVNILVSQQTITYDLTDNKIYTLSDASKNAVQNMEAPVHVKAYISPDLPMPFHTLGQSLDDLLGDYANASNGKFDYEIIYPDSRDKQAVEKARKLGIEKVAIGQRSDDEVSLRAVYKGVVFKMGDRVEVIKDLRSSGNPELDNFEYEFTKALLNLNSVEPKKIAFLAGFGGPTLDPRFLSQIQPMFQQIYGKLLEVSVIDLSNALADENLNIDESIDAVVILNIDETVNSKALFLLDQYIQSGGSVGWYQSASGIDVTKAKEIMEKMGGRGQIPDVRKKIDTGLNAFFEQMGLKLNSDMILDRKKALAMGYVNTDQGPANVSHPASFLLEDLDRTLPFVALAPALVLPAPSSITVTEGARKRKDLKIFEIAKTDSTSIARQETPGSLNYKEFVKIQPNEIPGPFVVAAAISGNIPTYYRDAALPEGVDESKLAENSQSGRVLIVGSGDFFVPNPQIGFNNQLSGLGGQFLLSSIEWLAQNTALSEIRGKKVPRIVGEVPKEAQRKIQFANIIAVPSMFALIGIFVVNFRRRRRENFEL